MDAWEEFWRAEAAALPYLCRPSVPILYFGNSERFDVSPLRVITVGKNPSDGEFRHKTFAGFYGRDRSKLDLESHLGSLDAYFNGAAARPHP